MHCKTTLDSGLRVVTKKLENTQAVTVLVLAGAGSRYENLETNGIAHFIEHMFFKGAKNYQTPQAVSEAIDSVGGDFNAFTGKEYAGYYVKLAVEQIDLALDVLSDMLLHPQFGEAEIDRERGVILEEYNMYQDTPMYQIGWKFEELLFGDQPLGRDQIGTPKFISSVKRDQFLDYKSQLYTAENLVVSVAGNIEHQTIVEKVNKFFKLVDQNKKAFDADAYDKNIGSQSRVFLKSKKTEQAHLAIGGLAIAENDELTYAQKLLAVILGGNMSSRMFLSVREARGLCYYVRSHTDDYTDVGAFSTSAGVAIGKIDEAVKAILEQNDKIIAGDISDAELNKAKNFLKGKMVLRLEESAEFAHLLAKFELLYGELRDPETLMKKLDAVTLAEVNQVAKQVLKRENLKLAVIGPYDNPQRFEDLLTN